MLKWDIITALKFWPTAWSCFEDSVQLWPFFGTNIRRSFGWGVIWSKNPLPQIDPNINCPAKISILKIPPVILQVDDFWENHLLMDRITDSWLANCCWPVDLVEMDKWKKLTFFPQGEARETNPRTWVKWWVGDGVLGIYGYIRVYAYKVGVYTVIYTYNQL